MVFDSISSNIDEVLSINPSANVFVFGDFNVYHKDLFTYSGGTNRPGELCYNFAILFDLPQMVNFPTQIPDCDSHSPALLDFFLSSDTSICSTMAFPPLGNSDHVVVSVSIDFPTNSQQDAPFYRIAYDYSFADWDGLCDHSRDVPWEVIFKLGAAANEFCEWVQVGIDVCIPHRKYQVKPHSSPWFSGACDAAIIYRKSPLLPRNLDLMTSGELLIVFSRKVKLPYLLYSMARRCYILRLIKQNCLLKIFL